MSTDEDRVHAELCVATIVDIDDDLLALVGPPVVRAASELAPSCVPVGLLLDVAYLLVGPPARLDLAAARASTGLPVDDAGLRRAVAAVFDALVAPIAASAMLTDVRDALARHPRPVALDAAGVLTAEIVARAAGELDERAPRLADLRRAMSRAARDVRTRGTRALAEPGRVATMSASYSRIASAARRAGAPLGHADVVVAEGAPHLRHRAARLALRQLAEAESALTKALPAAILHRRTRGADVTTREHDESTYPMGGFASMTNVGSLENVVTSELAFAEDGDIGEDLFAIRWAIGELLYYTRDESLAHRRRVVIWVVLSADLDERARVKDEGSPFQRIIFAMAAASLFVDRAAATLRHEALAIHVVLPRGSLDEERTLLKIRLGDLVVRGVVDLRDDALDVVQGLATDGARSADVMLVEIGASRRLERSIFVEASERAHVSGAAAAPAVRDDADPVSSWSDAVRLLLASMP